jgi:hypothetical protein
LTVRVISYTKWGGNFPFSWQILHLWSPPKYARLPEIYKHQIRIQFNNEFNKEHAEQILSSTIFDEQDAIQWNNQHQYH